MTKVCASCGADFEARRSHALYCSGACKKRASETRSRTGQVVPLRSVANEPVEQPEPESAMSLAGGLRSAYKPADLETPAGLVALRLAADVDALLPGSPGYAATVKQMREAMDELKSSAKPKVVTPLAAIRERRAADRASSAG